MGRDMTGRLTKGAFAMAMALAPAGLSAGASAAEDPLAGYRWKSRVLVVAAPDASNDLYRAQREALAASGSGRAQRDLVTLEAIGPGAKAEALRRRLDLPADAFRAVLVGKDGGVKLSSDRPISPRALFATIDAMPMRQDEMRRR